MALHTSLDYAVMVQRVILRVPSLIVMDGACLSKKMAIEHALAAKWSSRVKQSDVMHVEADRL